MTERQRRLLQMIETAFQGVELGDGVSLHETVVLDEYGSVGQRRAARASDEKHDWRKLIRDPELIRPAVGEITGGGLAFYDAAGFRFHLPAYLSAAVIDPYGNEDLGYVALDLLSHLSHFCFYEHNQTQFALLIQVQRACVAEVLKYLRGIYDLPENEWPVAEADYAIENYWVAEGKGDEAEC